MSEKQRRTKRLSCDRLILLLRDLGMKSAIEVDEDYMYIIRFEERMNAR